MIDSDRTCVTSAVVQHVKHFESKQASDSGDAGQLWGTRPPYISPNLPRDTENAGMSEFCQTLGDVAGIGFACLKSTHSSPVHACFIR